MKNNTYRGSMLKVPNFELRRIIIATWFCPCTRNELNRATDTNMKNRGEGSWEPWVQGSALPCPHCGLWKLSSYLKVFSHMFPNVDFWNQTGQFVHKGFSTMQVFKQPRMYCKSILSCISSAMNSYNAVLSLCRHVRFDILLQFMNFWPHCLITASYLC